MAWCNSMVCYNTLRQPISHWLGQFLRSCYKYHMKEDDRKEKRLNLCWVFFLFSHFLPFFILSTWHPLLVTPSFISDHLMYLYSGPVLVKTYNALCYCTEVHWVAFCSSLIPHLPTRRVALCCFTWNTTIYQVCAQQNTLPTTLPCQARLLPLPAGRVTVARTKTKLYFVKWENIESILKWEYTEARHQIL